MTLDNQRAAVNQAHWYDPEVNPAFVDFANHWGFAVIPARPFKPQDKGANESGIGVIQRQFYQEVRERKFSDVVLLGMGGSSLCQDVFRLTGGSSLCPDVFRLTFGPQDGHPRLHVLDTTGNVVTSVRVQ